jgi:alkylation response protein AidB-like acyl-CoA dehydrogenase
MSAAAAATPSDAAMTDYDAEHEIFGPEHRRFRERIRPFVESVVAPAVTSWDASGRCDRSFWRRLGDEGLLGLIAPPQYGGAGLDFRYNMIVMEELARVRAHALMFWLHADIGLSYLLRFGSAEQKERYVPALIAGEILVGVALTEPQAGSDLAALSTRGDRCQLGRRFQWQRTPQTGYMLPGRFPRLFVGRCALERLLARNGVRAQGSRALWSSPLAPRGPNRTR